MASRLWVPVASGPLASYAAGYGSWLAGRGYSRWTVAHRSWHLDLLSRWLEREGVSPGELTPERVREFLAARRRAGFSSWLSERSTVLPLEYLRELGAVPAVLTPVVDDRLERLLVDYGRYPLDERGLTEHTVFARYVPAARLFLTSRVGPDVSALEQLSGADVSLFMAAECPKRSVSAARDLTGGLCGVVALSAPRGDSRRRWSGRCRRSAAAYSGAAARNGACRREAAAFEL